MQFSRLRLTGFKSFVEPTDLHIETGLTGIVGPNGCGKSNLVEALRWVMGETSAKQMRGAEMDDVIFAGTVDRPARNLAEVLLTLDNNERRAPSEFNDSGEIDVSRRIERGEGSVYRVNGREVRARDVQILFADAATGARSTALVSQGRVSAVINAKPTERRHLLEEAAGITGLYARRHEAELRLKAAETNLARLDDVLGTLDEQLRGLKRQARQATRYRNLSDHIRRAEAVLLHRGWNSAKDARQSAERALKEATGAVVEATRLAAAVAAAQAEAAAGLPVRRQAEAEAAAALQRLVTARETLAAEAQRIESEQRELADRQDQINADATREETSVRDADAAVERLEREVAATQEARAREIDEIGAAEDGLRTKNSEVASVEEALTEMTRALAADEARLAAIERQHVELDKRHVRLVQRCEDVARERATARAEIGDESELESAKAETVAARARLDAARAELDTAERDRAAAQTAESALQSSHRAADAEATKLRAEAGALAELLEVAEPNTWPPLLDGVAVTPGYESALGAALGDDLIAPADDAAPIHWRTLAPYDSPSPLPAGAQALSQFASGPPALGRRICQIGVVEDDDAGRRLAGDLAQGQRLVSRQGALWRWDGFTIASGAQTAAATRLSQRNRLADVRQSLAAAEERTVALAGELDSGRGALEAATAAERGAREAVKTSDRAFEEARNRETGLVQRTASARSRLDALIETDARLRSDLNDLEAQIRSTRDEIAALPELATQRTEVEAKRRQLGELRAALADAQGAYDRAQREAAARRLRLDAIAREIANWQSRKASAAEQLAQLDTRRARLNQRLAELADLPAEIETKRLALSDEIAGAERRRGDAAQALAADEARLEDIGRDLRAKEKAQADCREERVRREAAFAQAERDLASVIDRVRAALECRPEDILGTAGIDGDAELPEAPEAHAKLERLMRERETMGPVNLRAEAEATELGNRIETMQAERADLTAAIAKLRHGISNLNREGRQRLLAAFAEIDRHFQELFKRLFGGGRAHLALTEAEDPLEAGLEVMASPPGKKLQSMSLLSGGEQALAAISLLFAVFLTNPAPICVLDEVDAPLDDNNVDRFCTLVADIAAQSHTRFLVITHHRITMARMDRLYGVTMAERGISQLVSVDLQTAERLRETA